MDGLKMKYFVLNPNKRDIYGEASRRAIAIYSETINDKNKKLSRDLLAWMCTIDHEILDERIKQGKIKL